MAFCMPNVVTKGTPASNSSSGEFTLYVNDLPGELNEHGLLQIFNHYGNIIGHFYRSNATWAYITYGTYGEAENAIKDLHNVSPLRLKVSFAREKEGSKLQLAKPPAAAKQYENHVARDVRPVDTSIMQARGRGQPMDIFKKIEPNAGLPKYTYTADDDLLYSHPSDPRTFNPYENAEPYANTNTLWTRGQLTVTDDGKKHVSMGRGYTMYEIPDPDPEVQSKICKVYEKRTSGLYEYGQYMLEEDTIGKCKKCSKLTKFNCEKCHVFYCSRNCQIADWPQHKIECQAIPALVTAVSSMHSVQPKNEVQTPIRSTPNIQMPLRRPKKLVEAEACLSPKVLNAVSNDRGTIDVPPAVCNDSAKDITPKSSHAKATDQQNGYQKNEVISEYKKADSVESVTKKRQNISADDVTKIEEDIAFSKQTFLSKSKFTEVRIILKMGCEYWVQKVEDDDNLVKLMTELQSEAEVGQNVKPVVGKIYAVPYEGVWHRGTVTCLNPLTVNYIDYGNDEVIDTNEFREINKHKNVPRYSAKIRISGKANEKYKHLKYEDIVSVRMISVDSDKVINVEVEGENDAPTSQGVQANNVSALVASTESNVKKTVVTPKVPTHDKVQAQKTPTHNNVQAQKSPSQVKVQVQQPPSHDKVSSPIKKLRSIVNTVPVGEIGVLEIHAELSSNTYSITLLPNTAMSDFEKLLTELPTMCEKISVDSNHRPQVGDIMCGQRLDGDWLRGYVLSLQSPLKMAMIDEARMMTIGKTVPCSDAFLDICAFGATCEVNNAKSKFAASEQYEFKVTARKTQSEVEIEISNDQERLKAVVKPWVPMPEQKGIQYAELGNGTEVCLTAFRSHIHLFARSLTAPELERYNYIMQNIAKCAQTAASLKEAPVVGQMVISQYIDDNYYRAIVTKVLDDKITIAYIDFGNTEVTNIKKLKVLSDDLKQLPSCSAKILLGDVPEDVPMTKEVSDYLSYLVGAEVPLILTRDLKSQKPGVHLKTASGEDVSKKLSELLAPTWNKPGEEDTTCYMVSDVDVASLGKVGDVTEVLVLHPIEPCSKYAMCPLDFDIMTHVFDIMPKAMAEYCEQTEHYIPREKELCLALFESGWYRAACICRSETPTTSTIFFIDFGNVESINHKDIRPMTKDFTSPNALASICNIVNLVPNTSDDKVSTRISELIVPNNCIKIKIVQCHEATGVYSVELPAVKTQLIEDGLVSS